MSPLLKGKYRGLSWAIITEYNISVFIIFVYLTNLTEAKMKSLIVILALLFASSIYSQTDTALTKRFEAAEYNIDMAGRLLQDAAGGFNRAWLFGFMGSVTSGFLIATLDKTDEGNINGIAFLPAIAGWIGAVWNFFLATGDMREAGYFMKKSRKR